MKSRFTIITLLSIALLLFFSNAVFSQAEYDTLSIKELQYVPNPGEPDNSLSPFNGDTVVVGGLVMHGPRDLWVGARWAVHIVDPDSFPDPWSGFFIIQHDTFDVQTNFGFVEAGMFAYFTGVVDEFGNFTQIALLTGDDVVQIDIRSQGNPLPAATPIPVTDLESRETAEQWESMFVRVENVSIVNNQVPGGWASFTGPDGGSSFLAEYFNWFRDRLWEDGDGSYSWPAPGTRINADGFVRDEDSFTINPSDTTDLEILSNPPEITDVERDPALPTSTDAVTVSATIVDNQTVDQATLHYSVDLGAFQQVAMTADADTFLADIPAQADGAFVRYFLSAEDNEGDFTQVPGDTSTNILFYVVRDEGLMIKDVQYTWDYPSDASGYAGYEVTLEGVVTTDPTDFLGEYYIQENDSMWSGIWVRDGNNTFDKGDWIQVTGTVEERFGVTRINNVTNAQVVTADYGVPEPVTVTTGEIATGGVNAEAYESVLVQVENVEVIDRFPDGFPGFGEFVVDDGSGGVRVDDASDAFEGQTADTAFALGATIDKMIAVHYFSFGNYKLAPRDTSDIVGLTAIEPISDQVPVDFSLTQNYPNPFNPVTKIQYSIAQPGKYVMEIYNILGQRVKTLVSDFHSIGQYSVQWNGNNDFGVKVGSGIYVYTLKGEGIQLTKKMIMLK